MDNLKHPMRRQTVFASAVVLALAAGPVWSAGTESEQMERGQTTQQQPGATGQEQWRGQEQTMEQGQLQPADQELYSKTADEIIGMDVIGQEGNKVGTIDTLVVDKTANQVEAVLAVDQFLGLVGGKKITIPLAGLQLEGDKLKVPMTKEELKQRPEYNKDYYSEITQTDRPISEFAAFEKGTESGTQQRGMEQEQGTQQRGTEQERQYEPPTGDQSLPEGGM